jgi:hypothetical protein
MAERLIGYAEDIIAYCQGRVYGVRDEVIRKLVSSKAGHPESLFGTCKGSPHFVRETEDERVIYPSDRYLRLGRESVPKGVGSYHDELGSHDRLTSQERVIPVREKLAVSPKT